ncbi:uncharacterized protein EI90DRAFT_3116446 [Cantharellus anzutake]|uniref:uncharacterized protein n=1 Tax=Cantharellus anzutake TaxID=1750568 RepID=UPI001906768B|nr:uncharacterized protein EI90DRAFT_3116446 [Cantharellus anzutake]KAF8341318.1 hypothetical protein EI90DRAFT_3116446 [Cantharellus anzutake]
MGKGFTWSWQEVGYAMEQRIEDNAWRIAFTTGLYATGEEQPPSGRNQSPPRCKRFEPIELMHADPYLHQAHGKEGVNASAQYFYNCMKEPSTASTAALMFEAVGHVYVVKRARGALCIRALKDGNEQQLH